MNDYAQSPDELREHLAEQLRFLKTSADGYDQGVVAEAKRMAVAIRILVHDSPKSKSRSLLGQLNEKQRLFLDTSYPETPGNITHYGGLIQQVCAPGVTKHMPLLDDEHLPAIPMPVPFDRWWNSPIFRIAGGIPLTRSDLVLAMADQDGGAHVDARLKAAYAELSRGDGIGFSRVDHSGTRHIRGEALAAVRQIAHEVIKTLDPSYVKHVQLPPGATQYADIVVSPVPPAGFTTSPGDLRPLPASAPAPRQVPKIGRNEKCPCGSGIKYKRCHGRQ
jgi:hypothetical protein